MLTVIKSGPQTTVQDLGRPGYQRFGVVPGGAMDTYALRIANLLAGNPEDSAALEVTLGGFRAEFLQDAIIAITGGDLAPKIDGRPLKMWRTVFVPAGSVLSFGSPKSGCRAYIAAAGGMDVPLLLGSRSTYLRANFGGYEGRALRPGDRIPFGIPTSRQSAALFAFRGESLHMPSWSAPTLPYTNDQVLRLVRGRQQDWFSDSAIRGLFAAPFIVTPQSDRMGCRLEGTDLTLKEPREMISEAVAFGSVQVPPDGKPIVLLADRQTAGGYPKIAQIASADLPLAGQLKPGDSVQFEEIGLEQARKLYVYKERFVRDLSRSINLKWKEWD